MEQAFRRDLHFSGYNPEYVSIVTPGNNFEHSSELWKIEYQVNGKLTYCAYISPLTENILKEMSGVIVTSALIAIVLTFGFWYLLHVIKRLRTIEEMKDDFTNNMTHELKTPIAVIKTTLEVLTTHPKQTIEASEKWINYLQTESNRMEKLVNDLLFLAKSDSQEMEMTLTPFSLSDALMTAILPLESVAFESHKQLALDIEPELIAYGDVTRIQQVVVILLDNAIKHALDGSTIHISLKRRPPVYELTVQNTGTVIATEDLPKIFDRFYRADASRTRETGGHGLGLAIAKSIITAHHGNIFATSTSSGKTTFVVTLPIKPS